MNPEYITEKTRSVFHELSREKFLNDYTLVGGTSLSLRINHRLSEDLDFIYDDEFIDSRGIRKFIDKRFKGRYKLLKQDDDHQLDFLIEDVKVTFFSAGAVSIGFDLKKYSEKYWEINVATTEIISVLKVNEITQRNTVRDYYDLYFIAIHYVSLKKIFEMSKELLPNLPDIIYTETILYTDDIIEESIGDHLQAAEKISKLEMSAFFENELKKYFTKKN